LTNRLSSGLNYLLLILRILPCIILFPHGFQLAYNYHESIHWLTDEFGLPSIIAFAVIVIQFYAVLFLIFGLASRYHALSILLLTLGSSLYHFTDLDVDLIGFNIDKGIMFHILLSLSCMIIITKGGGKYSADRFIISMFNSEPTQKKKI